MVLLHDRSGFCHILWLGLVENDPRNLSIGETDITQLSNPRVVSCCSLVKMSPDEPPNDHGVVGAGGFFNRFRRIQE
jgi:hypothetical protein